MLILVTGGSASGKSEYAENRILELGLQKANGRCRKFYLATMTPYDEESRERVKKHRLRRAEMDFETIEKSRDLGALLEEDLFKDNTDTNKIILLEDCANLIANEMFPDAEHYVPDVAERVFQQICSILKRCRDMVIVTDEIFSDGRAYDAMTAQYLHELGELNCLLAGIAHETYEVVYGIPVRLNK